MDKKLQNQLFKKYPKIFRQHKLSFRESCMGFGIETGNGWYELIDTLCGWIQFHIDNNYIHVYPWYKKILRGPIVWFHNCCYAIIEWNMKGDSLDHPTLKKTNQLISWVHMPKLLPIPQVEACQVKEKFGSLRFYIYGGDDEIRGAISFAQSFSAKICERCGQPGTLHVRGGWFATLCGKCAKKEHFTKHVSDR
jgi:hypothetical protein